MMVIQRVGIILMTLLLLAFPAVSGAQTEIINIRHWSAPDHTRIVIDTSEDPAYEVEKIEKKLFLEVDDAVYSEGLSRQFRLKKPGIDRIVVTPRPENRVLIELHLTEHTETKVFKLQRIEEKPFRIVIDIVLPEIEKKETEERERVSVSLKKKIVVIDPGHGGDDPGAVGRQGTYEKDIVLAISRRIKDLLNRKAGYRAFLTRDGDYYVPFKKRLKIAREYHADLFLSVHADAEKSRQAAGASVYSLSFRSASSEAARILARNENLADIVGGVSNGEAVKDESDPIVLNMFQTNTMNSSRIFGSMLLRNLSAVNRIKFASVQEAPFMVLKLPEIPSVLVETAFLSHPREEKMLRSPKFQKEIAETIVEAAAEFLDAAPGTAPVVTIAKGEDTLKWESEKSADRKTASPPVPSAPAVQAPAKPKPLLVVYKVKKGDALERIARKYGTTAAAIEELNHLKADRPLYVDLKLKIPVSVEDEAAPPAKKAEPEKKPETADKTKKTEVTEKDKASEAIVLYTVKKGETLDAIAVKNGTTLAVLLKLNSMKLKDPLIAGSRIRIPSSAGEGKKGKTVYTVKKGDTLETIARKNKTTIGALKKINGAKKLTPLYVDQKLEIPGR